MKDMFVVSDEQLKAFIQEEFCIGQEAAGESITEGQFIKVLRVHFRMPLEMDERVRDSHTRFIKQLLRLYPEIKLGAHILGPMRIVDYRWRKGGYDEAFWSEFGAFVAANCRSNPDAFVSVAEIRDLYNGSKKMPEKVASTSVARRLLEMFPGSTRSVHRTRGLNARCIDGAQLVREAGDEKVPF